MPFPSNCIYCYSDITNPVCLDCYLKQFKTWIRNESLDKNMQRNILLNLRKRLMKETLHSDECIICNNEQVNICFYCFSKEAYHLIIDNKANKSTADSFLDVFSYKTVPQIAMNEK
jgi:hypothetical protein